MVGAAADAAPVFAILALAEFVARDKYDGALGMIVEAFGEGVGFAHARKAAN